MLRYLLLALMFSLVGCSRPAPPPAAPTTELAPEPVPVAAPTTPPAPEVVAPKTPPLPEPPQSLPDGFPRKAFWGEPGTTVEGDDGSTLSKGFAAVPFGPVTLYPVQVVTGVDLFFAQDDDRLQLNGTLFHGNGYFFLADSPTPLGALPYALTEFPLHNSLATGIAGFETVATPAGEFPAVVFRTEDGLQWWSPGVGLVQYQTGSGKVVKARQVVRTRPEVHSQVVRFAGGTTAILTLDGIYTQDGTRQVTFKHEGQRPSTQWVDIGAGAPVASHGVHSQVFPHWRQEYFALNQATGKFQPVVWRFPNGEGRLKTAGMLVHKGTSVFLYDAQGYPETHYRFEWTGRELEAVEATPRFPETEEQFVRLLTRPMLPEVWVSLFTDAAAGRQAYDQVMKDGRNLLAEVTPGWDKDGAWMLKHPGTGLAVSLTLTGTGPNWRVASWTSLR